MSSAKQIQAFIQSEVTNHPVVIFSKSYCPYCRQTKQLFQYLGVQAKIHELDTMDNGALIQRMLLQMTGQRTVPSVFVNGQHVGGNDDVQEMHRNGSLAKALKESTDNNNNNNANSLRSTMEAEIAAHDVVVFSKTYCPYCRASKELLKRLASSSSDFSSLDVVVHELDELEEGDAMQQELLRMTGQRTVPNIFVRGQHIGGNSDLQQARANGSLQARLKKTGSASQTNNTTTKTTLATPLQATPDRLL